MSRAPTSTRTVGRRLAAVDPSKKPWRKWSKAPGWVISSGILARLRPSATKVLAALIYHADGEIGTCDPGVETIGRETGLGKRTVRKAIRELEQEGVIKRLARGGGRATAKYQILFRQPATGIEDSSSVRPDPNPARKAPPNPALVAGGNRDIESEKEQHQTVTVAPSLSVSQPPGHEPQGLSADLHMPEEPTTRSSTEKPLIYRLVQAGMDSRVAKEMAREAGGDFERVEAAIRNRDYLQAQGRLRNPDGYLRQAIRLGWELVPELLEQDREAKREADLEARRAQLEAARNTDPPKSPAEERAEAWARAEEARLRKNGNGEYSQLCQEALARMPESIRPWVQETGEHSHFWKGMRHEILVERYKSRTNGEAAPSG